MMHRQRLKKSDGRQLLLYSTEPLDGITEAPQPAGEQVHANSHLRWHPLRAEWVAYAQHRQERTFLPPAGWDPLAPTRPGHEPTELPAGSWHVAVFENRFPSLDRNAQQAPESIVQTAPGYGECEVVVYTQAPTGGLADLAPDDLELLIEVWADRIEELGARDGIEYVMPFENRGVEVGATLQHPHGQIYAYPFVPPIPARELAEQLAYHETHGRGLLEDLIEAEMVENSRVLFATDTIAAFVPAFARYPYEVWIAPRAPVPALSELDSRQRADLGCALRDVLRRYDAVRGAPFPYVMVIHQRPTDGAPHPEAHVHFEFYPQYRSPERLKFLAGTEIGAGMFTNDALPEAKAAELLAHDPATQVARR